MKKNIFLFLILFMLSVCPKAQENDSISSISMVFGSFGFHLPGGDMADRFGESFTAGAGFMYKTDQNWLFGVEFDFLFGNQVREDDLFSAIETENGYLIDASGLYADVFTSERGFKASAGIGKLIPLNRDNLNSGLLIMLSPGLLQHKIRIDNRNNAAPQMDDDYARGYDRLTNGFCMTEFIGYYYSGKYRLISFFAGLEFNQAWTRSRRDWDFDKMSKDKQARTDLLNGIRIGWVIQLSRSNTGEYFYY